MLFLSSEGNSSARRYYVDHDVSAIGDKLVLPLLALLHPPLPSLCLSVSTFLSSNEGIQEKGSGAVPNEYGKKRGNKSNPH